MKEINKLALVSFLLGVFTFIHVFGIEKAIFSIILGMLALKDIYYEGGKGKLFAFGGIILATLYIIILTVIAIIKGPELFHILKSIK